jgi:hypothetical protein
MKLFEFLHVKYVHSDYRVKSCLCPLPCLVTFSPLHAYVIKTVLTRHMTYLLQLIFRNFDHKCSELRCEVCKFVAKFIMTIILLLQGPIRHFVYKLVCEFQYEFPNFATNLRTLQRSSEHLWSKFGFYVSIFCFFVPIFGT